MVGGMTSAENMVLAESLATLARQVEEKVGQPLPMTRDQVLGVMVQSLSSPNKEILRCRAGMTASSIAVGCARRSAN